MELLFLHFYPDLMNLYGSYANVLVLQRMFDHMGHTVSVQTVTPGTMPDETILSRADFWYMGAGTERRQRFALDDFRSYADTLKSAASDGATMLFTGTAMELLGQSVTTADGETFAGIGLTGFSTVQKKRRIVGDVLGHIDTDPNALYGIAVVGFMNKSGIVSGVDKPLLTRLELGFGNEREKGPEGFRMKNVFGSELTGPILVKNPRLLETVAGGICNRREIAIPEPWPIDPWAEKGYAVTVRELDARCQKK